MEKNNTEVNVYNKKICKDRKPHEISLVATLHIDFQERQLMYAGSLTTLLPSTSLLPPLIMKHLNRPRVRQDSLLAVNISQFYEIDIVPLSDSKNREILSPKYNSTIIFY